MNRLALKIKEARIKAKMSEKDLAKAIGQNINYILQIESGKKVINEKLAEQILSVLNETMDFYVEPEPVKEDAVKKITVKPPVVKEPVLSITPNESWTDALSGVIKEYPVFDEISQKILDHKSYSVLNKKVEGLHFEKVMFVKVTESECPTYRIHKDDVLTIQLTHEIQNQGIYYLEMNQKKMIRKLVKSQNQVVLVSKGTSQSKVEVPLKDLKIIGKVIKVEFFL